MPNLNVSKSEYKSVTELAADNIELFEYLERLESESTSLKRLCLNLAAAMYYGEWVAETYNEKEIESILVDLGYWPITEDRIIELRGEIYEK